MDDLSKGQRATVSLLPLGASAAPLVIDQPEDGFDNRFVHDGVVSELRELKGNQADHHEHPQCQRLRPRRR
ncbi:hypothetical protein GCM10023198_44420 [Promicromonospora umidemergens]|uniref:Uncharacterized protein n=1 Tax=Promicromonospora umidemergens TaxID=629679 RepID=A0ABP8XXV6_9MICO|nr:hypothetical protein [Promicromonospora umidemergens]